MIKALMRPVITSILLAGLVSGVTLAPPSGAAKVPSYPMANVKSCRAGYLAVTERQHGRTAVDCLLVKKQRVKLHSIRLTRSDIRIDPSFTQSASNPLDTVWLYSVSDAGHSAQVPPGVLSFRLQSPDGSFSYECALNVGGSQANGGACEIPLQGTGKFTTIVEYSSGTNSTEQTESVTVNPFTATLSLSESTNSQGQLVFSASAVNQNGFSLSGLDSSGNSDLYLMVAPSQGPGASLDMQTGKACAFYVQFVQSSDWTGLFNTCGAPTNDILAVPTTDDPSFPVTFNVFAKLSLPGYVETNTSPVQVTCSSTSCSLGS
jgi:hypothetical protein